jgi:hypothetical protein
MLKCKESLQIMTSQVHNPSREAQGDCAGRQPRVQVSYCGPVLRIPPAENIK